MKNKLRKSLLFISVLLLGSAIVGLSFFLVNIIKNKNDENDNIETPINQGKDKYLSLIDANTKRILDYSTYSVSFKFIDENVMKISYGTAWSLGVFNDSWLLMTNLHVVKNYLEYKNSYGNTFTNVNSYDFGIMFQNFDQNYSNNMENFLPYINCNINLNTNISIISDPNLYDDVKLFANETTNNKYELDMAIIKIENQKIATSVFSNVNINKPLNLYKSGTKPISQLNNLSDLIVGGYPIKENNHMYDKYYLEVIDKKRFWFDELSYWNTYIFNYIKPNNENFKQYASMLTSRNYIIESNSNDYGWLLSGGASGSPLFNSISYQTNEPLWIPVAIYWGGLSNNDNFNNEYIKPCFTMLISSLDGCSYNIFNNIINFFNI